MIALLLSLLTRFSFAQAIAVVAVTSVATVAVAGSAQVITAVETAVDPETAEAARLVAQISAPPVVSSEVTVEDPGYDYTVKTVSYRLAEVPTSIAAITFRLTGSGAIPGSISVRAAEPAGAFYRCRFEPVSGDLAVTCETRNPELPVARATQLTVEVHS